LPPARLDERRSENGPNKISVQFTESPISMAPFQDPAYHGCYTADEGRPQVGFAGLNLIVGPRDLRLAPLLPSKPAQTISHQGFWKGSGKGPGNPQIHRQLSPGQFLTCF
jgi:hypothetical protein